MKGFNLSRWALDNIALTRYLIVVLLLGGIFGYQKLGQDEDPPFTFRIMVVSARWPGATAVQMAQHGHRQARGQAAGNPVHQQDSQLFQAGRDDDHPRIARIDAAEGNVGRVVPGAQEDRRHRLDPAGGRAGAVLQR
jgi:hypothetical protein